MSSRRQKLLARVNWCLQPSLEHITEWITGDTFYYKGSRYRQVSLYLPSLGLLLDHPWMKEVLWPSSIVTHYCPQLLHRNIHDVKLINISQHINECINITKVSNLCFNQKYCPPVVRNKCIRSYFVLFVLVILTISAWTGVVYWRIYASLGLKELIHWGRDKSLLLRVQLTIFKHWSTINHYLN